MSAPDPASATASPTVSVVIATYNWSGALRHAIESVRWQTVQDVEVLVIGDACTDDSGEVVAALGDPRLRWHNRAVNSGSQSMPNNDGLERARGRYVAYLGHDDLWWPTHLATLVETIERTGADLAHALTVLLGPPGSDARIVAGVPPDDGSERPLFVPPSSMLHRRDLIERIGPWRDHRTLTLAPDREFQQRAWEHRRRFASSGHLTVFKFPASWRPNSYRERRSDEQAEYGRRMREEPDFLERELLAIVRAYAARTTRADLSAPEDPRPGWSIQITRWIRGLEQGPPPAGVEELFRLQRREADLLRLVEERTAWARGLDREIATRDALIDTIQTRANREVAARDAIIRDLQGQVAEMTAWAQRLDGEVATRDAIIRDLQARLDAPPPSG
jgi:hypothetical protein